MLRDTFSVCYISMTAVHPLDGVHIPERTMNRKWWSLCSQQLFPAQLNKLEIEISPSLMLSANGRESHRPAKMYTFPRFQRLNRSFLTYVFIIVLSLSILLLLPLAFFFGGGGFSTSGFIACLDDLFISPLPGFLYLVVRALSVALTTPTISSDFLSSYNNTGQHQRRCGARQSQT